MALHMEGYCVDELGAQVYQEGSLNKGKFVSV